MGCVPCSLKNSQSELKEDILNLEEANQKVPQEDDSGDQSIENEKKANSHRIEKQSEAGSEAVENTPQKKQDTKKTFEEVMANDADSQKSAVNEMGAKLKSVAGKEQKGADAMLESAKPTTPSSPSFGGESSLTPPVTGSVSPGGTKKPQLPVVVSTEHKRDPARTPDSELVNSLDESVHDQLSEFIELTGRIRASVKLPRCSMHLVETLKMILEGDEYADKISVPMANQRTLHLIKTYVTYHIENEPKPTPLPILKKVSEIKDILADPWDAEFLEPLTVIEFINLIPAANYLNIKGLLDILKAYLATRLIGCEDYDLFRMITKYQWPNKGDSEEKDIGFQLEKGDDDDDILGLDDLLLEEEKEEQEAPILLRPCDYETVFNNNILRLRELLKSKSNGNSRFNTISDDFLESAAHYSSHDPNLMVSRQDLLLCGLAQDVLDDETNVLEVKQVTYEPMVNVARFLKYHQGIEPGKVAKPIRSIRMEKNVEDPWDAHFIDSFDNKQLKELVSAANYMNIRSLLMLSCCKLATLIKGKSPEEIRQLKEYDASGN